MAMRVMVSGGPWVLSILSINDDRHSCRHPRRGAAEVNAFQICVTYLMAGSLIWTGGMQLMFTRFVADRTYADDQAEVLPNLFGVLLVTMAGGFAWAAPFIFWFFEVHFSSSFCC